MIFEDSQKYMLQIWMSHSDFYDIFLALLSHRSRHGMTVRTDVSHGKKRPHAGKLLQIVTHLYPGTGNAREIVPTLLLGRKAGWQTGRGDQATVSK